MENYAAIFKTINDKIAESEIMIEYYREEVSKKDNIIRDLNTKIKSLEEKIENLTF